MKSNLDKDRLGLSKTSNTSGNKPTETFVLLWWTYNSIVNKKNKNNFIMKQPKLHGK